MTERFSLSTEVYQGPLETLLNMIEERKMSISDISLAEVTDAYLAYVEKLPELPLGETAQFILVASTLLLIKSRALLPSLELSTDERESVEELERRLARYALIRKTAKLLRGHWGTRPLLLAHRAPLRPTVFSPADAALSTIAAAAARLVTAIRTSFRELTKSRDRNETIVYFLATLELVRSGSASVTQERLFEDITIELENAVAPRYGT